MKRRQLLLTTAAQISAYAAAYAAACTAASSLAWAQAWPTRSITIVVPTGAGGGYDQVARLLSDAMARQLGQSIVVDNRVGAGSRLGTQAVANAAPDGYTLLLGGLSNMVFNAGLYPNLSYDPVKDFVPVGLVARVPYVLVARADLSVNSVAELVAMIRADPDKLTIGTAGNGTGQHVEAVAFAKSVGVKLTIVPYKSAGSVYQDLLGGRVDLFVDAAGTALPHVESKRAKALAISSATRDPRFPGVPTVVEAGLPLMRMDSWYGVFAPSRTPAPVLDKLKAALKVAVGDPAFRKRLDVGAMTVVEMSPPQTDAFLKTEYTKWTGFIKEQEITGD